MAFRRRVDVGIGMLQLQWDIEYIVQCFSGKQLQVFLMQMQAHLIVF